MAYPPEELLRDGPEENVVRLEVRLCLDSVGCVWSLHKFATPEDEEKALQLAGHGVRQIAFALVTEALRRETYNCALVEMTKSPTFLADFMANPQNQGVIEEALGEAAVAVLTGTTSRLAPGVARETLNMMISQMTRGPGGTNPPASA